MLTQHSHLHWGGTWSRTDHSPERESRGEVIALLGGEGGKEQQDTWSRGLRPGRGYGCPSLAGQPLAECVGFLFCFP